MIEILVTAIALSATASTDAVYRSRPVVQTAYPPSVSMSMTLTGSWVIAAVSLKEAEGDVSFHWQTPANGNEVWFSRTITVKSTLQLAGSRVPVAGAGRYSVWVYDRKGRKPFAHGELVVPLP